MSATGASIVGANDKVLVYYDSSNNLNENNQFFRRVHAQARVYAYVADQAFTKSLA